MSKVEATIFANNAELGEAAAREEEVRGLLIAPWHNWHQSPTNL